MASVRYINRTLSHDCASKYDLKVIFFLFQIQPAIVESNLTTSLPTFFLQAMDIQKMKNQLHLAAKEGNLLSVKEMIQHSNPCDNNLWCNRERLCGTSYCVRVFMPENSTFGYSLLIDQMPLVSCPRPNPFSRFGDPFNNVGTVFNRTQ